MFSSYLPSVSQEVLAAIFAISLFSLLIVAVVSSYKRLLMKTISKIEVIPDSALFTLELSIRDRIQAAEDKLQDKYNEHEVLLRKAEREIDRLNVLVTHLYNESRNNSSS